MRYFSLPLGWNDAEYAYSKIEHNFHKGGQYPVGLNHCWHSGVHIKYSGNYCNIINPLINGTIVACRLADKFATIPRLNSIRSTWLENLSNLEQFLYRDPAEDAIPADGVYELKYKEIDRKELTDLDTRYNYGGIEQWFEKNGNDKYEPIEKVSMEYVLIEHNVTIPKDNNSNKSENTQKEETIIFYTLYMGLHTVASELKKIGYYDDFVELNKLTKRIEIKLPIFQKWFFRLNFLNSTKQHRYKDIGGGNKVFKYSTCTFEKNLSDPNYICKFINNKEREITVLADYIDEIKTSVYYKAISEAPVYKITNNITTKGREIATVSEGTKFSTVIDLGKNNEYFLVVVYDKHVAENSFKNKNYRQPYLYGWVANAPSSRDTFKLEDNKIFSINKLDSMPQDYFAILMEDYCQIMQTPIAEGQEGKITIIGKISSSRFTFYCDEKKVTPIIMPIKYDALKQEEKTLAEIKNRVCVCEWRQVREFDRKDYVKIINNESLFNNVKYDYIIRQENIKHCRFIYPNSGNDKNALVQKKYLKRFGEGYLNDKTSNSFLTEKIAGCILYDSYGEIPGNARLCLEKDSDNRSDDFEIIDSYALFAGFPVEPNYLQTKLHYQDKPCNINYKKNGNEVKGFISIDDNVKLEAKIKYTEDFKEENHNKIVIPKEELKVDRNTILGYPSPIPFIGNPMYDLALFFDDKNADNNIFKNEKWKNNSKTSYYLIPPDVKFYTNILVAQTTLYLPQNTEFSVEEVGGAYKLTLEKIRLYFSESDLDSNRNLNNKINNTIWINLENMDVKAKKFAEYFWEVLPNLINHSFYNEKGNPSYWGLDITFEDLEKKFVLWAKTDKFEINEDNKVVLPSLQDYTFYEDNPNQFVEIERKNELESELITHLTGKEIRGIITNNNDFLNKGAATRTFHEARINGKLYYLLDKDELIEKNYLDFQEYFKIMKKSGIEGSIVCDHRLIAKEMTDKGFQIDDVENLELDDFFEIIKNDSDKKAMLRTLVCKHHLEWNKALYDEDFEKELNKEYALDEEQVTHLRNKMKKQDLWTSPDGSEALTQGNKAKLPPKEQVWFAHPIYFINHLDKAGLLDMTYNPYEGEPIKGVRVVSNPGFAPFSNTMESIFPYRYDRNGKYYAKVSSYFNLQRPSDIHAGIDFYSKRGQVTPFEYSPIHSFIYGEVVQADDQLDEGFGVYIIVKSRDNPTHHYLLGHLKEREHIRVPVGTQVTPGMEVALSSNTGKCYSDNHRIGRINYRTDLYRQGAGSHLHVQFIVGNTNDIINRNINNINIKDNSYNPFVHSEKFGDIIRQQ